MPNMGQWNLDQALGGTSIIGRASVAVAAAVLSNEIVVAMRGRESDDTKAAAAAASRTGTGASLTNNNSISSSISPNNSSNSSTSPPQQLQDQQAPKPGQSLSSASLYAAMVASYEVTSASPKYSIDDVIDANSNYVWHATERDGSWDDGKDHSIDDNDDDDDEKWIEIDTTFGEW